MSMQPSRRDFFRTLMLAGVGGAILPSLISNLAFADEPAMIDMTGKKRMDAQNKTCVAAANGVHYHDDAKDVAKEYKTGKIVGKPNSFKDKEGKEIPVENRMCEKCALYGLGKPGTCALITGCLVNAKGGCISWSPKPA